MAWARLQMTKTGDSRATDEDLRLTVVHLVVALVTKLQWTKISVSFDANESSSSYFKGPLVSELHLRSAQNHWVLALSLTVMLSCEITWQNQACVAWKSCSHSRLWHPLLQWCSAPELKARWWWTRRGRRSEVLTRWRQREGISLMKGTEALWESEIAPSDPRPTAGRWAH